MIPIAIECIDIIYRLYRYWLLQVALEKKPLHRWPQGALTAEVSLDVEVNDAQLSDIRRMLGDLSSNAPAVMRRSINKTLTNTKTFSSKKIRENFKVKASRVKEDFKKSQNATNQTLWGVLRCKGTRISLMQFGARQVKKGVTYQIRKRGGRKTIPGGFVATGKNANQLVFVRTNRTGGIVNPFVRYGRLPHRYRFPIRAPLGPSIPTMMEHSLRDIQTYGGERLQVNIGAEVSYALQKYGG